MKKILILLTLFTLVTSYAQKELWSVNASSKKYYGTYGTIAKYDINGLNPMLMHEFDSIHGYEPEGKLFLASNGKLYGTTQLGGNLGPQGSDTTGGVLFEYDLVLDKYRVVKYFEFGIAVNAVFPRIGVIEPVPGQLYGATNQYIYKYDIATETTTILGGKLDAGFSFNSELMKASDGNLYGTASYRYCQTPLDKTTLGVIFKINTTTNKWSIVFQFGCNADVFGAAPVGQLIEVTPGKLMGVTNNGGIYGSAGSPPAGTLFEFDITTNVFTKKIDFEGLTTGGHPTNLVKGDNGKLYGVCHESGVPPQGCSNPAATNYGTLFEYTPATNVLEVKQNFTSCPENSSGPLQYPTSLMRTSNGDFMGTVTRDSGIFKYDATTNTAKSLYYDYSDNDRSGIRKLLSPENLIEICRKPSYHEFTTNTFNPCVGDAFTFDVQNTNAATYVWKKNEVVVPLQTTGVLTINNALASDTGVYTCTMTNECGITTTMALNLNVDCLGIDPIVADKNAIALYPNPTKNSIAIHLPENEKYTIQKITIINILGQTVIDNIKKHQNIDVSALKKGIYILVLKTDKGDWNGKFVRE
ncbi:T9SS type A sorting domain-containing protein [Flavobacterium luteum]|uniref:T9SS type A sorting domain-containing protein n=1 Tax=Flavobacterium luteum TaxID=2026654 RepID=A0A7J5AH51_9FLAO|nr:T9SS type A sorting domain-containing protein [Flavobacterium luteum]KAB1156931.1 T9SS type A sorting domain-containing protein [Flavobacterium luteum]